MIVLATAATVIASQAVITGAYSLVHQAIQLGMLPRLAILHTSASHAGQIYIPRVTTALLVGVLLLVGIFHTSSALASAYGIAVTTTMVVDGLLAFIVVWKLWNIKLWQAAFMIVPLVIVDFTFFSANLLKLFDGAWAPLLFGASMVLLILTWRRGTTILAQKTRRSEVPLESLVANLEKKPPHVVPGTAVFLTSEPDFAPTALLHNLKHNKVLHQKNVILTIVTTDTPRVTEDERVKITELSPHFSLVALKFGYMETAGASTSCRRRFSCRDARLNRPRIRECHNGRTGCSLASPSRRATPPTSSRFQPGAWLRWGRKSRCRGLRSLKERAGFSLARVLEWGSASVSRAAVSLPGRD